MKGTVAALVLFAGVTFAQPQTTLVSPSLIQSLPPNELTRRVIDQVGDLLEGPPARRFNTWYQNAARKGLAHILSRRGEAVVLGDVTNAANRARLVSLLVLDRRSVPPAGKIPEVGFRTPFMADLLPGMCVSDDLPVQFLPLGTDNGSDAPVKAAWLYVSHKYHFAAPPPVAVADPAGFADRRKADEDCAKLEGAKVKTFFAESDAGALRGYWLAQTLRSVLAGAAPSFPMDCEGARTAAECKTEVLDTLANWYQVMECEPETAMCTLYALGSELRITATSGSHPAITGVALGNVLVIQQSAD